MPRFEKKRKKFTLYKRSQTVTPLPPLTRRPPYPLRSSRRRYLSPPSRPLPPTQRSDDAVPRVTFVPLAETLRPSSPPRLHRWPTKKEKKKPPPQPLLPGARTRERYTHFRYRAVPVITRKVMCCLPRLVARVTVVADDVRTITLLTDRQRPPPTASGCYFD